MHILTEIYRGEGVKIHGKTIQRTAVRAVIWRGKDLLMVYSAKVGDYKFPGSGVEVGETHEQTLTRELREECGVSLVSVDGELGAIVEYNFPAERDFDVFKMTSHYYFCRIESDSFSAQKLDGYEEALGFRPVWVDGDVASQKNRQLLDSRKPPEWLKREIFALEYLKQMKE